MALEVETLPDDNAATLERAEKSFIKLLQSRSDTSPTSSPGSSTAIILIPILFPIGAQMGFDPVHYGVVIVIALVFAGVTPPVGVLLFITSSVAKSFYSETCRYLPKYLLAILFVLFLSAYVSPVVTFIPNLFLK